MFYMRNQVGVQRIQLMVDTSGTDKVVLYFDASSPFPKMGYEASATLEAQHGCGLAWVRETFEGVPVEVINRETGERTFL